jgi:hypothetical protein
LPPSETLAGRTVILVNPPSDLFAGYVVILRAAEGHPLPPLHWLATGTSTVHLERLDERRLRVRLDGGFIPFVSEHMLRDPRRPFARGQEIRTSGVTLRIVDVTPDGRPAEIVASFDEPLDGAAYYWMAWSHARFVPYTPPPVGQAQTLAATRFIEAVFGK